MVKKIPTYSICNLLGTDRCVSELVVIRLKDFLVQQKDLYFPHRHDFYQIVLFTQGTGKHSIDFQQYEVSWHQVYYMAPGQIHTWNFDEHVDGYLINFNESFFTSVCHNPNYVKEFPLFNTITGKAVHTLSLDCCAEVEQYFAQILQEYNEPKEHQGDILRSLLSIILVKLSRAMPSTIRDGASKHNVYTVRQFEKLIELHFREKRLPKEYAEMLFITANHLNALTTSMMGVSAGEMIRNRVLLEAKRLLVNSDWMIAQIADHLNFDDNAYFTRFFKKYTGITPEQFRESSRF